jgi:predicted PurR-regulated permease PerM
MAVFGLMFFFGLIGGILYSVFNQLAVRLSGSLKDTWTTVTTAVFAVCGLIPSFHIIAAPLSSQISPSSFEQTLSNKWENQSLSDTVLRTFAGNSFIFLGVHLVVSSIILFALESPSLRV